MYYLNLVSSRVDGASRWNLTWNVLLILLIHWYPNGNFENQHILMVISHKGNVFHSCRSLGHGKNCSPHAVSQDGESGQKLWDTEKKWPKWPILNFMKKKDGIKELKMYWLASNVESREIFASSKYMSLKLKQQQHSPCIEMWHLPENLSFWPLSSSLQSFFENSHLNLEDLFLKAPAKSLRLLPPHP